MTSTSIKRFLLTSLILFFFLSNSISKLEATPLSGNYTVGSGLGFDFASISESIDSLSTLGVSGSVVILIDTGMYNEQIEIPSIPGASSSNTITFRGKGNNTLIYFSPTTSDRAVIRFNASSHLIFDSLMVEARGTFGIGFQFFNLADSITIKNCYIELPNSSSTNKCTGIANYSTKDGTGTSRTQNLNILNNTIEKGFEGIRLIGDSKFRNQILIENNTIFDFGSIGSHTSGIVNSVISQNHIYSSNSNAARAINMWPTGHTLKIVGNIVELASNVNHTRVIQIANSPGGGGASWSEDILVANNIVRYHGKHTANMTGIYTKHVNFLRIYNNTVRMSSGTGAKSLWLDALSSTGSIDVKNNNLTNDVSNGQLFRVHGLVSTTADYNNHYNANGTVIWWKGTTYNSLSAYQTGTSQGSNSVEIDPKFVSSTDAHIDTNNFIFDNRGTPLSQVTLDIDGDKRSISNPDIGADEYSTNADVSMTRIVAPINCQAISPFTNISVWIKNLGTQPISDFPVALTIDGGTQVNEIHKGSIASMDSSLYTFTYKADFSNEGFYKIDAFTTLLSDKNTSNDSVTKSVGIRSINSRLRDSTGACSGNTLLLEPGVFAGASYLWSDNSTKSTLSLDVSTAGLGSSFHWVKITDANGCSVSDTIKVIFSAPANVDLGSDTALCIGDTVKLNPVNPGASFLWQDNSTLDHYDVTIAGTYRVTITTGYQCSVSDTIEVSVNSLPNFDLGNNITICDKDSAVLDAGTFSSYLWQDNSSNSTYIAYTQGKYWVNVTDSNGCIASDSIEVKVNPIAKVDLGKDTSICEGSSVLLDASSTGIFYFWNDFSTSTTLLVTTEGLYSVVVTNNFSCKSSDSIYITVNPLPTVDLGSDSAICEGTSLEFDVTQTGASYLWQDASTNSTLIAETDGKFWVEVTSNSGCVNSDSVNLTILQSPIVDLGKDTALGIQHIALSSYKLNANDGFVSYLWSTGSTAKFIDIDDSYGLGVHEFSVIVTGSNGCQGYDTILIEIQDISAIGDIQGIGFSIHPNPSSGKFTLDVEQMSGNAKLHVVDILGKIVLSKNLELNKANKGIELNMVDFPSGMYTLYLKNEKGLKAVKLVIAR